MRKEHITYKARGVSEEFKDLYTEPLPVEYKWRISDIFICCRLWLRYIYGAYPIDNESDQITFNFLNLYLHCPILLQINF